MKATTPSHNCARPEVTHSADIPIGQILVPLHLLLQGVCQEWSQQSRCEEQIRTVCPLWASQVAQWWRIHLPMQEMQEMQV